MARGFRGGCLGRGGTRLAQLLGDAFLGRRVVVGCGVLDLALRLLLCRAEATALGLARLLTLARRAFSLLALRQPLQPLLQL